MSKARTLSLAVALLLCTQSSEVRAQDSRLFEIGSGFADGSNLNRRISHGHAYLVAGEPGFIFSGIEQPSGSWKLNYLILIRHSATPDSSYHHHRYNPAVPEESSAWSDGKTRFMNFHDEVRFDDLSFHSVYKGQFRQRDDTRISEEFLVQRRPFDLTNGRVFVVDMSTPAVVVVQINVPLPSTERINLMRLDPEDYKGLTSRWLEEIATGSEVVRKTFGK